MRKVRPQDVCSYFTGQVDAALAHYTRVLEALKGTGNEKLDISVMSATLLHSVFVDFECFLSDLFVAYMNRDFTQYQATFEASVRKSVTDKHSAWLSSRVTFNRPAHMTVEQLAEAIDPTGFNLSFSTILAMKDKARVWLADPYKAKVLALDGEDERLVDTAKMIRNWIAHQSKGSGVKMNVALADIEKGPGTLNHELGRGVREITSVGAFLKTRIPAGRRVEVYARRLKEVAINLTV